MNKLRFVPLFILLALMLGSAGCGLKFFAPKFVSPARQQIIQLNESGQNAYQRGDFEGGIAQFQESLHLSRSVEDYEYITKNIIHLAALYRAKKDYATAQVILDGILDEPKLAFPAASRAEAHVLRSLIYLDLLDAASARTSATAALSACARQDCDNLAKVHNLLARLDVLAGSYEPALKHAREGQSLSASRGDLAEEANGYRLIGDALAGQREYDKSIESYLKALELDHKFGASSKVYMDLEALGRTYERKGAKERAVEYYRRALMVSRSTKNEPAIRNCVEALRRLGYEPVERTLPVKETEGK